MPVPVIGVTTNLRVDVNGYPVISLLQAYVDALEKAGAAPVLLPSSIDQEGALALYQRLDGILFTGGGDVATERFHGEFHPAIADVETSRDETEIILLKKSLEDKKPFLGICRGIQLINVGLGGTLYTHIEDQKTAAIQHDQHAGHPRDYIAHPVEIQPGTQLADSLGKTTLPVNSLHHQGIKELAKPAIPAAFSPDGLVEALEIPSHPFGIGVQWHPEWLTEQDSTWRLFRAFIEAGRKE